MDTRTAATHSLIGQHKSALDTPALLVDLEVMESNIARIVATCRAHGVAWRPHSKAHKTPEIAQMQIAAGAIGVTCAKLGEAEVMAAAGIRDILIANQIVGPIKIAGSSSWPIARIRSSVPTASRTSRSSTRPSREPTSN
jgi:D-serine deaminase-like pyridoxal phosphate-dependent protein